MALGMEGPAAQARIRTLAHDPLQVLLEHVQVPEHHPLKLATALRIGRDLFDLLQGHRHIALEDLLPQSERPAEAPVRQLLNVPQAQILAAQGQHELLDLLLADAVHAHELAHDAHVGIDRKRAAKELLAHLGAHLPQQPQAHAHPGFADREFGGDRRHAQVPHVFEFVQEAGLFEDAEALVLGRAQQTQNPAHLVGADRAIGHRVEAQLAGTAIALEAIEQNPGGLARGWFGRPVDAFQRLLDAALGNRRQKPGFHRRHFEAVVLVTQVQRGQFNFVRHTE